MQNQAVADHAVTLNTTLEPSDDLPEYVEVAAREIHTALSTFLRSPTIINPNGGDFLPWVSEVRVPAVIETSKKTGKIFDKNTESAWFETSDIDDIAARIATDWCQPPDSLGPYDKYAQGVYWTINPVTPSHLENYGSDLRARKTGSTRDVDIIARYWLPIDADAIRIDRITGAPLSVVSSTASEKANLCKLIAITLDWLCGTIGWPEPITVDTGNGNALFYALPAIPIPRVHDPENPGCLKYNEASDTLIKDVLYSIAARYANDPSTNILGGIDTTVYNPSRIMKIPGTIARKAKHSLARPHRVSRILSIPESIIPVTLDQLRLVADMLPKAGLKVGATCAPTRPRPSPQGPRTEPGGPSRGGPVEPTSDTDRTTRIARAINYLAKVPIAKSGVHNENGQTGGQAAMAGLGKVIRRFALTKPMALEAIGAWNSRCEPPWDTKEIDHKLDDIYKDSLSASDWGKLLDNDNDPVKDLPDELQPWVVSKDLETIIHIYLGARLDTGAPVAVPADSKLHQLYLDVRADPGEPKIVKSWCKSSLPAPLRAAWWKHWQAGLQHCRNSRTESRSKTQDPTIPYCSHNGRLCIYKLEEDEEGKLSSVPSPLCNFDARITMAIHCTLRECTTIEYKIRASMPNREKLITISASEFATMNWPVERLGGDWAIGSGRSIKDNVREAIQLLSGNEGIKSYTKYNHTGWINHNGADYYLHKGGAIGADGVVLPDTNGFIVDLGGALPLYTLPVPPSGSQLVDDVQATLRLCNIGKTGRPNARGIAAATVALPWRAVLGACNYSVVYAGGSGGCKTSLGCLALQHFAPDHAYDSQTQAPVTWEATVASLEWLAHSAKDTILFIDNFIADAAKASAQQFKAATILNNQGDMRGRERMGPDMKPLPSLSPRCGLLSTGEDTAARGSAKGRSLLVSVTKGETNNQNSVDYATLTPLQSDAAAGVYARTMAAYTQHVAARGLNSALDRLKSLTTAYHNRAMREEVHGHARTPGILADLAAGYRLFLEWASTIDPDLDLVAASKQHWKWLTTLAPDQDAQQEEADDALRWRSLVHSALTVGRAYIAGPDGAAPSTHQAECGWKSTEWQDKNKQITTHWSHPEAPRIGWFDGETIYLDENETTQIVQQIATSQRNQLSQPATIKNRLVEKGWLQPGLEMGKTRYTRISSMKLEGARRRVWVLSSKCFWPDDTTSPSG